MASSRTFSLAASLLLLALVSSAAAEEAFGPEFGNNKFTTGIGPLDGQADVDVYRGRLIEGERLSVTVTPDRKQSLQPTLELLDPAGAVRDFTNYDKSKAGKRVVAFKSFPVDRTGSWTVRVSGATATTRGAYTVAFKIQTAKPVKVPPQDLGATTMERSHTFGGLEGGLLDLKLSWGKKDEPVEIRALTDPQAGDVPSNPVDPAKAVDAVIPKKTKKLIKKQVLATGDGDYAVTVGIPQGTARYKLLIKAKAPARPKGRKAVSLAEIDDPVLSVRVDPLEGAEAVTARLTGRNLVATQRVFFAGVAGTVVAAAPDRTWIDVVPPAQAGDALVDVAIMSTDGQAVQRSDYFRYLPPMSIASTTVTSGTVVAGNQVPLAGGHRIAVVGANLDLLSETRLGGQTLSIENADADGFEFDAPSGAAGPVSLEIEDHLGRTVSVPDLLHYTGFVDVTGQRSLLGDASDDFSGWRGAIGDLDNDSRKDDFALASYNTYTQYLAPANSPGTQSKLTRILAHSTSDRFVDRSAGIPDAGNAADWNAGGLGVGDLDGNPGAEILIAGGRPAGWDQWIGGGDGQFRRLRLLVNNGAGSFTANDALLPEPLYRVAVIADTEVTQSDGEGGTFIVQQTIKDARKAADHGSAIALGDLDGDGDLDAFLGTPRYGNLLVVADSSDVDYGQNPPYIKSTDVVLVNERYYYSATRVIMNEIDDGNGLVDTSETSLPGVGASSDATPSPAFHARDIALGDVDGNGSLDAVVAWSNPASVTPLAIQSSYARYVTVYNMQFHEYRYDATLGPMTATRVLTNDGDGNFTDETSTWMPANVVGQSEFWQAHKVRLADLDGDGDLDMLLLHRRGLDAFTGETPDTTRSSLRILRNERIVAAGESSDTYVDVTASAVPTYPAGALDNWRGNALTVFDVNQDGHLDVLVGTREQLVDDAMARVPSMRLLLGNGDLTFTEGHEFLPPFAGDSGEVDEMLIGDFAGGIDSLILLSEVTPTNSTSGQSLRIFDWER